MAEIFAGKTRRGQPLADGLSQESYNEMMQNWTNRFPHALSGVELEERFRQGGISAALHKTPSTVNRNPKA